MKCHLADTCKIAEKDCTKEYHDKAKGHCYVNGTWVIGEPEKDSK